MRIDQGAIRLVQNNDQLIAKVGPRNDIFTETSFMSWYLTPDKIGEVITEEHLTYLPLPFYICTCMTDYNTKNKRGKVTVIIMQRLGKESKAYSYTHDQLKYLAWQVMVALCFIHQRGRVTITFAYVIVT